MTKFLTLRNALISGVAGVVLLSGIAVTKAIADDDMGGRHGPAEITLEAMLEKTGERFDAVDTDANGTITQLEADAAAAERGGDHSEQMAERLTNRFERMDTDGDGIVQEGDRGYGRMADMLDLEGPVSLEDVQAAIEAKMAQRAADHTAEMGDDDAYPQTRDTALAQAEAKFAERDTNSDGILSGDELPERGERGGKNRGGHHGGERGERN